MDNKINALFLDVDGVLNSVCFDRERTPEQSNIDETRLPLLKRIMDETGAVIVLSSSLRRHWDKDPSLCDEIGLELNRLFDRFQLTIYDKTPVSPTNDRAEEIRAWLDDHPEVEAYAILDDIPFGWGDLQEHLVKTNPRIGRGLEERHVRRAIYLLK